MENALEHGEFSHAGAPEDMNGAGAWDNEKMWEYGKRGMLRDIKDWCTVDGALGRLGPKQFSEGLIAGQGDAVEN